MIYRADIDGLRAVSVLSVILYHMGSTVFSGGYVGVDVFFVISGYLITSIIYTEINSGIFTFKNFYKRRSARLLPALIVTLIFTLGFGFIFYTNSAFDNLGKEVFFSVFGLVNILYSQGVDYFASNNEVKPLLHLWSLGVEEQFYIFWPLILMLLKPCKKRNVLVILFVLFLISLIFSILSAYDNKMSAYYLTQYRAFELLIGAGLAIALKEKIIPLIFIHNNKDILSKLALLLILIPIALFDSKTIFPGYNALIPCFGAALLILIPPETSIHKCLSNKHIVFIGLISYPLYLVHQPIITYFAFFNLEIDLWSNQLLILAISILFAWLIYYFIEKPFRSNINNKNKFRLKLGSAFSLMFIIGLSGFIIAKSNGLSWRFQILNPFAFNVSEKLKPSFHQNFPRGNNTQNSDSKILMIGDSVLQQYAFPITKSLNLEVSNVDTVTRGGCVLLKGVEFEDKVADISCETLRENLYSSKKKYEIIFISQHWLAYDTQIKNSPLQYGSKNYSNEKWKHFLNVTIEHFIPLTKKIVIIGQHIEVSGTEYLKPSLTLDKIGFLNDLSNLKVNNIASLDTPFVAKGMFDERVSFIEPYGLWCAFDSKKCVTRDNDWAFFTDAYHASSASNDYLVDKLMRLNIIKEYNEGG